jgi:hypothetical protein
VLLDGAFTHTFDETRPLLYGLAWLAALLVLVTATYRASLPHRSASVERQPQ